MDKGEEGGKGCAPGPHRAPDVLPAIQPSMSNHWSTNPNQWPGLIISSSMTWYLVPCHS